GRGTFELWAWSPTGAQLVLARGSIDGDALSLIDPATGDRTDLGKAAGDVTALAWSPDGSQIAYTAVPAGTRGGSASEWALYSVAVDGGDQSLLATGPGEPGTLAAPDSPIQWSPDGSHIVVQADETFVMNADGSDLHQVGKGLEVQGPYLGSGLSWSPDGTRMAYATLSGGPKERRTKIWNASPDGSAPILVFESARGHDV